MRQSVINYVKENGIKLAANSKALKLINNGASEAEVAVALQTTKAYKEDSTLRQMCQEKDYLYYNTYFVGDTIK